VEKGLKPRQGAKKKETARRTIDERVLVDVVVGEVSRFVATGGVEVEHMSDASVLAFEVGASIIFA
jgi:hypothetical protein